MFSKRLTTAILFILFFLPACSAPQQSAATPHTPPASANTPATAEATLTRAPSASPTLPPGEFINPVLNHDFPDPDALKVGNVYYAFATNSEGIHVEAARSPDLVHWKLLPDALPTLPSWAVKDFGWTWAPDVNPDPDGKGYLMYFTSRFPIEKGGSQCIGVAAGDQPEGPFISTAAKPLVCQLEEGGSIDPDLFRDSDGTLYLLWKNDGNSNGGRTWIYIQPLSKDGRSLQGKPTQLITADQPWEGVLVEGPILWERDGKYYLFYSANDFNSPRYAVGYAVADKITGPYQKAPGPFLQTDMSAAIIGPGGEDIVTSPHGETWMLFHSWTAEGFRRLNIVRIDWNDGVPGVTLTKKPQKEP
ncbi:MAG: glycoside hydrolase family 43 protein [Omnitrophica WOR_2 bacterium]